jgi:hypothetical protein
MSAEWPHITALVEGSGLTAPRLDYPAEPYPAEELRKRASESMDPWFIDLLTRLAEQPATLNALNRQPTDVRNLNACMHYLVASKLEIPKRARERVATAWRIKPSMLKDAFTLHGATAAAWLDNLIEHIDARSEFATHEDIHRAIDADLTLRAAEMARDFRRRPL